MIPQHVIKAFNIKKSICELTGGCQKVYRAGNVVLLIGLDPVPEI
jgi:hypothetical protein